MGSTCTVSSFTDFIFIQKFIGLVGTVAIILTVELFYKFTRCYVDFVVLDHIISVKLKL